MKKKLVILNTTFILGLSSAFAIPSVKADTLHSQNSQIQQQRAALSTNLSKAEKELNAILEEQAKLSEQISRVNQAITDNNNMIAKTEKDIVSTKAEVEQLKKEIEVIQERIDKRTEILKGRAVSYQENGNSPIGFVEVLLGATDFGDFIERVGAVTKIVEADQDILTQHDQDKKLLVEKQSSVQNKLAELEGMKTELLGMKEQMEEQKQQTVQLKNELNAKQEKVAALKADLKMQDSTLASKQAEIQNRIEASRKAQTAAVKSSLSSKQASTSSRAAVSQSSSPTINTAAPAASGDINTVLKAGYKYIGNSVYVFGAGRSSYDVANGRFDCSGFVSWAFSQAGVSLPAYTGALTGVGTQVSASSMRPGDLVFFDTYKRDGHVGIYLGGGKFIGSQSSTGVAVANMSSGYWKSKFNGRVIRVM
jgi:peptidoglycan DL-endopeptidase CwlO